MKKLFRNYIGLSMVCGLFLLAGVCSLTQMIIYTPDSARYLVWANSLAHGEGLKDSSTPESTCYVVHAPLYPFLLMPSAYFFPQNVIAAKVSTLLIGCLVLALFHLWLKRKFGGRYALLGSFFLALNSYMIIFSTQILSDVPFASCLLLFFLLAEKIIETENPSMKLKIGFLAVIIAGVFLREVGFTLMLGAVFFFLWKKNYRYAILIFAGTFLTYLVWYVRNEIIIAGIENPALRNTNVFFMHLYTSSTESLLAEFGARLWDNLSVYTRLIGKIVFIPSYPQYSSSLISVQDPLVIYVLAVFPLLQGVLIVGTIALCAAGIWYEIKNSKIMSLIAIYCVCYCTLILLYPINDVRFLFPLLILLAYFCTAGILAFSQWMTHKNIQAKKLVLTCVVALLLLPNGIWVMNYVKNSWSYRQSPEQYYDRMKGDSEYPWQFTKPVHLAAGWITQHSDSSIVVLSRWKELTFWLEGRKLIFTQPQINPDVFDRLLRDYPIRYIVGAVSFQGLNEYENLLNRSRLYTFKRVFRTANLEIFEALLKRKQVSKDEEYTLSDSSAGALWHQALGLIEDDPKKAERIIQSLILNQRAYTEGIFHVGVAKELAMELDSAVQQFEKVRLMPQAGAFVQQSSFHIEMISQLQRTYDITEPQVEAQQLNSLATHYWELGYRKQAIKMLQQSLEKDPRYFLSHIFYAFFSLQLGDTLAVRKSVHQAQAIDSTSPYVTGLVSLLNYGDSLSLLSDKPRRDRVQLKIARTYLTMGLEENAIEELHTLLRSDSTQQTALRLLGALYEKKQRFAPAANMYKRLALINPADMEVRKKLADMTQRVNGCSR
jgi:Tfp pilus assembly protein PilF